MRPLKQAVKNNRPVHAYLFLGNVGLIEAAQEMAMVLNCPNLNDQGDACGICSSCYKIQAGVHPDVCTVKPDGLSIKIQQVRELQKNLSYKVYEARYKVVIFEEADTLTSEAANSLLKTLEEPFDAVVFMILARKQMNIPDTIVSRCQIVYFRGMEDGLDIVEAQEICSILMRGDMEVCIELIEKYEKAERNELQQKIASLMVYLRDLLVFDATSEEGLLHTSGLKKMLQDISIDRQQLLKTMDSMQEGLSLLEKNANKRMILEKLFFELRRINKGQTR